MFVLQAPLLFFNPHEAAVVDAMTARIIPRESGSPGAREARAIIYIDRALAGYFSSLQVFYREGIEMIDAHTKSRFAKSFANATEAEQDEVLRAIERSQFFSVVYEHTIEGTFGDPIHGGNYDAVGWKLIGFPGAQYGYTESQMAPGFDARSIPIVTLSDLAKPT